MSNGNPTQARDPNGQFASQTFEGIYDALAREVKRLDGNIEREHFRMDGNLAREVGRINDLRQADQTSLVSALIAAKTAVDAALAAAEKAVAAALIAAKEAVNKAEVAQQRTNEGQNEFRGQLKDQANTLMPRTESELAHKALAEKIDVLEGIIGNLRSRLDIGPLGLKTLEQDSSRNRGRREGSAAVLATAATVTIAIAAIAGVITGAIMNLIR